MVSNNDAFTYGVAVDAPTTYGINLNGPNSSGIGIRLVSNSEADTKKILFAGGVNGGAILGDFNNGGLTLQASVNPGSSQLTLGATTATLQGNLTVSNLATDPKIRLQSSRGGATAFEWRDVTNTARSEERRGG